MALPKGAAAEVPPGFLPARPTPGRHPIDRARLSAGMTYYSCSSLLAIVLFRTKKVLYGGAEGIRTPDLISAIDALSRLSYSPSKKRPLV
jgi:hypothetical protein